MEHSPGSVIAENTHSKYTRQVFAPAVKEPQEVSDKAAHVESWHLDINPKELRWESYVKAGYYVSTATAACSGNDSSQRVGSSEPPLLCCRRVAYSCRPSGHWLCPCWLWTLVECRNGCLKHIGLFGCKWQGNSRFILHLSFHRIAKLENKAGSEAQNSPILNKGGLVSLSMNNEKRVGECSTLAITTSL